MNFYQILLIFAIFCYKIKAGVITEVALVKVYVQALTKSSLKGSTSLSDLSTKGQVTTRTVIKTAYATASTPEISSESKEVQEIYSYSGKYTLNDTFALEILNDHNTKRELHGAQPLKWNSTVFEYAANYASKYDCSGVLTHSGGSYGENLAIGYTTGGAVDAWYNEGETYVYGTESVYNHFTALIWNSTNSLGCATKYCNSVWGTYIICSYYPAGNVVGESVENVFPLLSTK